MLQLVSLAGAILLLARFESDRERLSRFLLLVLFLGVELLLASFSYEVSTTGVSWRFGRLGVGGLGGVTSVLLFVDAIGKGSGIWLGVLLGPASIKSWVHGGDRSL